MADRTLADIDADIASARAAIAKTLNGKKVSAEGASIERESLSELRKWLKELQKERGRCLGRAPLVSAPNLDFGGNGGDSA